VGVAQAEPTAEATPVEPRYSRVMPWTLIAIGLAILLYAAAIRDDRSLVARETVTPAPAAPTERTPRATTQITRTEKTPSDTFLGALIGAGAVAVLAGAFYARVTRVTLPVGSIEMGAAAQDASAVSEKVREAVAQRPEVKVDMSAADLADFAAKAASATAVAQQQALQARAAARSDPESAPVPLGAGDLAAVRRGMPLSQATLDQLAQSVVSKIFDQDADAPSSGTAG
jgi:hypothetical protein